MKIKTIDLNAKEWFDKINGNSYFTCEIIINYKMKDEKLIKLPFQYGYDSQYEYESFKAIIEELNLKTEEKHLYQFCRLRNIVLRSDIQKNCLKRELLQ